jgi:DNA ligase-1
MRFPRISRIRWDKPPREADRLEMLMAMIGEDTSPRPAGATLPGVSER